MSTPAVTPLIDNPPPLDQVLSLKQDENDFFKALTGIQDEDALHKHIIDVQTKAYKLYCYPCIRHFNFTRLKIARLPAYRQFVTQLRANRLDAILLDAGCCFGNDMRKAVLDGWPVENVVGTDIEPGFWNYGHELFKSSPTTFPATFIAGDIFNDEIIQPCDPFYEEPPTTRPQSFEALQSLVPLQGHISAIHASSLFHLFNQDKQAMLASRLASLLSSQPGSIIFGSHGGLPEKGLVSDPLYPDYPMFCHDPESWKALWDGQVFKQGTVRVDVDLVTIEKPGARAISGGRDSKLYLLVWSVTRL